MKQRPDTVVREHRCMYCENHIRFGLRVGSIGIFCDEECYEDWKAINQAEGGDVMDPNKRLDYSDMCGGDSTETDEKQSEATHTPPSGKPTRNWKVNDG